MDPSAKRATSAEIALKEYVEADTELRRVLEAVRRVARALEGEGWKNVVVITALGLLYGVLAAWRRTLRVNMISHAWSDAWEGWLKLILFH